MTKLQTAKNQHLKQPPLLTTQLAEMEFFHRLILLSQKLIYVVVLKKLGPALLFTNLIVSREFQIIIIVIDQLYWAIQHEILNFIGSTRHTEWNVNF